jgi:hypothetical protein
MRTKQQIRDLLVNDPLYRRAILAGTEEDRKKIQAMLEPLFVNLISQMDEFAEKVVADPEACAELIRGLTGDREVVNSESATSGSTG